MPPTLATLDPAAGYRAAMRLHLPNAVRLMKELQQLGCRFALDDFGGGVRTHRVIDRIPHIDDRHAVLREGLAPERHAHLPCAFGDLHTDIGRTGYESVAELNADIELKTKVEALRLAISLKVGLGDVANKNYPKMTLIAPPRQGGSLCTRSFIPHRAHATSGVLAAVSVATAALLEGSPANSVAQIPAGPRKTLSVEHPTGEMSCVLEVDDDGAVTSAALLRTARKLMDGVVFG